MTAYLVFNELSASEAATRIEATRIFDEFFRIVVDSKIKGRKALVAPPQFRQIQLCPGHSIGRLLANATHWTADRRLRIKILLDRCASYEDCAGGDGELDSGDVEYRCAGRTAQGLATALLVDGLALSLQSSEQWDAAKVDVEKAWVAAGDIHFRILPVRHASKAEHL